MLHSGLGNLLKDIWKFQSFFSGLGFEELGKRHMEVTTFLPGLGLGIRNDTSQHPFPDLFLGPPPTVTKNRSSVTRK